jgi:hypothetical protein
MKNYSVEIPVLMKVTTMIKAENEKEAIIKAIENYDIATNSYSGNYEVIEQEAYEKLIEGNFFYGSINAANAEEEDY